MQAAKVGLFRWFIWALFSFSGRIKRLPFAGATFIVMLLQVPYLSIAMQTLAVYILPPPDGSHPSPEYMAQVRNTLAMVPLMLPICFLRLALDIKRLRSIGAPVAIAIAFAALFLFSPVYPPSITEMANMSMIAYIGVLAIIPSKEDRMSPLERKYNTWKAIATGDGTPRRLTGKDIHEWRIMRQGPAKKE